MILNPPALKYPCQPAVIHGGRTDGDYIQTICHMHSPDVRRHRIAQLGRPIAGVFHSSDIQPIAMHSCGTPMPTITREAPLRSQQHEHDAYIPFQP